MVNGERNIYALIGPTASGKTAISIDLAMELCCEIISVDSRQIYRFLDIGTAKPTQDQLAAIPHHFISMKNPEETYSAGTFGNDARRVIKEIFARGNDVLLVGGSGLYLKALIDGFFEGQSSNIEVKHTLEKRCELEGLPSLYQELLQVDFEAAMRIPRQNKNRIIRALEAYYVSGRTITSLQNETVPHPRLEVSIVGLLWERKTLYDRINDRVEEMMRDGFIEEVRRLLKAGYAPSLSSLNTVGYKEVIAHLNGIITENSMMESIRQHTRNYAKRQLTWFRKDVRIHWIEMHPSKTEREIKSQIVKSFRSQREIQKSKNLSQRKQHA